MATQSSRPTGSASPMQTIMWILLLAAIAAFAWSFFNYWQASHQLAILTDPKVASKINKQQTEELLGKLSKIINLPKENNPIVATINDVEILASTQNFYLNANNGDKLIVFPSSKKAIIYDPDQNKIVNEGPVSFNNPDLQKAADKSDRLRVEIRNGTTNSGAGVSVRDRLQSNDSFTVVGLGKAVKTDYSDTILIDKTGGTKADLVNALQKRLGGKVVTEVPEGEADSGADVLVIVGAK